MEEQTIIINDLLSFIWCKLKLDTVTKKDVLKCVQSYYSQKEGTDALKSLLSAFPKEIINAKKLNSNPFLAIVTVLDSSPEENLPIFVCKDLNNIPDIETQLELDSLPTDQVLYKELKVIKTELNEVCESLSGLKGQLQIMTDMQSANEEAVKAHSSDSSSSSNDEFEGKPGSNLKKVLLDSSSEESDNETDDSEELESDFDELQDYNNKQTMELIANRHQRALARHAENGKAFKVKKIKPLFEEVFIKEEVDEDLGNSSTFPEAVLKKVKLEPSDCAGDDINSTLIILKQGQRTVYKCANCEFSSTVVALANSHFCCRNVEEEDSRCFPCTDCNINFKTADAMNIHKMSHVDKDYPCPFCFTRHEEHEWINHVKSCRGNGTLKPEEHCCPKCEVYYADKMMLGRHMAYHDESRPFICPECNYRFYTPKALNDHSKKHSLEGFKYKCPFCEFQTLKSYRVREHIRCHTGDRPFECHLCNYATTSYNTLRKHQISHVHNKEYKCSQCDKSFKMKDKLRFHERAHNAEKTHKCPICGKGFNYGVSMSRHYKRHLADNTHKCPECDFKGARGSILRKHMESQHPNKYPYKCSLCVYGARFKSRLKRHMKRKHM